jgi:hypothetical protein
MSWPRPVARRGPWHFGHRKDGVRKRTAGVKKASGTGWAHPQRPSVECMMTVLAFILLTLAVLTLLGFAQRLFQR